MNPKPLLIALMLAAVASLAGAGDLYRWVDQNGKVHYTDQPPPPQARSAERKRLGDKPGAVQLPFALKETVKNFPVTLYTAEGCGVGCPKGVAYLTKRGVPFTEKDARIADNANKMMSLTGGKLVVPLLTVGRNTLTGFEQDTWGEALDAVGYPRSTTLPPGVVARKQEPKPAKDAAAPAHGQTDGGTAPTN